MARFIAVQREIVPSAALTSTTRTFFNDVIEICECLVLGLGYGPRTQRAAKPRWKCS